MDTTAEEKEIANKIESQSKLKSLIDDADAETLEKLEKLLNEKKPEK